jgi:hypothetical protein
VDFASLLLALALEVVKAIAIPLPVKVYVISLRLIQEKTIAIRKTTNWVSKKTIRGTV